MALIYIGKHYYDYTNDKGENYKGVHLHCIPEYKSPAEGLLSEVLKVRNISSIYPLADGLKIGSKINPIYDKYGRVADIILQEELKEFKLQF